MELRIGILECDHVDPELMDKYGDYQEMFVDLVHIQDKEIKFSVYDLTVGQIPINLEACDAYIITGSRHGVYEGIPWISQAKQLVRCIYDARIPTVGICFGHQLIAESLGGKVIKADDKGRGLGVQTWEIKQPQQWMGVDQATSSLSLNACHQDQVIKMPDNSKLLVSSDFCPIAGFQVGTMLGIQGHPEFDYDYTEYLFDKYNDSLDEESKRETMNSLNKKPDSNLVGAWMVNFIKDQISIN